MFEETNSRIIKKTKNNYKSQKKIMKGGGDKEVEEFSNAIADYQQVLFIQEEFNNRDIGNLKFNKPFFKSVIENVKKNYL